MGYDDPMSSQPTRWTFEATVAPSDKVRLRGFTKNEIAYYNALLNGFGSRLRTMPEVFDEVDEKLIGEIASVGYNIRTLKADALPNGLRGMQDSLFDEEGRLILSERVLLFLDAVGVAAVLHPEARRAMAIEMLLEHRRQAAALAQTSKTEGQVLRSAVELLHPHDGRLKRHVQLPAKAVVVGVDGRTIRSAYNGVPIVLRQPIPDNIRWNVLIIRDEDSNGLTGDWHVELRQDPAAYLLRLTDAPLKSRKANQGPRGFKKHSNA